MNDQKILEQLALHPQSRAVQLADRLDVDLVDVQTALAGLIAVGDVVASAGTSPAGVACMLYRLRKGHKLSGLSRPSTIASSADVLAACEAIPPLAPGPIIVPTFVPAQLRTSQDSGAQASVEASAPSAYRCALWSDGILEIQRDGETVAAIPKAAGVSIAAFLHRLARAEEAA
jgi:hypothetical protein